MTLLDAIDALPPIAPLGDGGDSERMVASLLASLAGKIPGYRRQVPALPGHMLHVVSCIHRRGPVTREWPLEVSAWVAPGEEVHDIGRRVYALVTGAALDEVIAVGSWHA